MAEGGFTKEELQEITETGIAYLLAGKFRDYTKNETIATILAALHDRIKNLESDQQ